MSEVHMCVGPNLGAESDLAKQLAAHAPEIVLQCFARGLPFDTKDGLCASAAAERPAGGPGLNHQTPPFS